MWIYNYLNKNFNIKKHILPWLVWLSGLSASLQTKRSPVGFPVGAQAWVAGQVPFWGRARGDQSMYLLHMDVSLSLFLISLKINKIFFKKPLKNLKSILCKLRSTLAIPVNITTNNHCTMYIATESKVWKVIIREVELPRTARDHISTVSQNSKSRYSVPFTSGRYCSPSSFFPNKLVSSVSVREKSFQIKTHVRFKSYGETPEYSECSVRPSSPQCPAHTFHRSLHLVCISTSGLKACPIYTRSAWWTVPFHLDFTSNVTALKSLPWESRNNKYPKRKD